VDTMHGTAPAGSDAQGDQTSTGGEASGDRSSIVGTAAVAAGIAFIAGEVVNRVDPDIDFVACATGGAYLVNVIDLLKYGLVGVTLLLVVWMLRNDLSRPARIVGRVAGIGFIVTGVANGIEHCAHMDALGLAYVIGVLIGLLGTAAFGVLLARSGTVPPWTGWVLSFGVLAFLTKAQEGGAVVFGVALIAVGTRLVTDPSINHPAR
jgi:hypothetical protein